MDVNHPTGTLSQAEALALRYGDGAESPAGPWNEEIATLLSHRSVRGFLPDALPEGTPYFEAFLVAAVDAALAAQNATVAAESLGLSMVYIGALRNNPAGVGRLLDLPPGAMALFGMCVGYPLPTVTNEVKPRLPQ